MENEFTASLLTTFIIVSIVLVGFPVVGFLIAIIIRFRYKNKENKIIEELYGKESKYQKNRSNGKAGSHGKF